MERKIFESEQQDPLLSGKDPVIAIDKQQEGFETVKQEGVLNQEILSLNRLKDIVSIFGVSEESYFFDFSSKAIEHIQGVLIQEIRKEVLEGKFIATCCETLVRFGFPIEAIEEVLVKGLSQEMRAKRSGEWKESEVFPFAMNHQKLMEFIRSLQKELPILGDKWLHTEELQEAARFRVSVLIDQTRSGYGYVRGSRGMSIIFIKLFSLEGEEIDKFIHESVEDILFTSSNDSHAMRIRELYQLEPERKGKYGVVCRDSIQEVWQKLQARFNIPESYQEMQLRMLQDVLYENSTASVKDIFDGSAAALREVIVVKNDLKELVYGLAIRSLYAGDTWLFEAMNKQGLVSVEDFKLLFMHVGSEKKIFLQRQCAEVLDPAAVVTLEILGDEATGEAYDLVRAIHEGDYAQLEDTGITKIGENGMEQLKDMLRKVKRDILHEKFSIRGVENNAVVLGFLKKYLRIDEREWGTRDLKDSLELYRHQGRLAESLDENVYQRSEVITVRTRGESQDFQYSDQFLSAFHTLVSDIRKAHEMSLVVGFGERKKPLSTLVGMLNTEIEKVATRLQETYDAVPKEKQKFVEDQIRMLQDLNLRNLLELDKNLQILQKIPAAHSIVRQLMFTFAFAKSDAENPYFPPTEGDEIQLDDITGVMNFVDHITYQETWQKYFADKRSRNNFRQIASTRALEEELERMQKAEEGSLGTTALQFIPTRGFLMEVSGSLADACWADVNDDLLAIEKPNFMSVTFVQNPETKDERIAGACMLIETESKDGEKLLVIRGLNPLENVINRLSVADFYKQFTEYCKKLADNSGRKLAIVIDDHAGGSSTNRPLLFQFLRGLELRKVILASEEDTEFNEYSIVNETFLVD